MSYQRTRPSRLGMIVRLGLMGLLVFAFILVVIITAVTLLTGETLAISQAALFRRPSPQPGPTPTIAPLLAVTPGPVKLAPFRSVALGLTLEYPAGWRKKETPLQVVFSATKAGLEPDQWAEPALWAGIPTDNSVEPSQVLAYILADFPANTKTSSQGTVTIAESSWTLTELSFETGQGRGRARVAITSKNEVGYFVMAIASAEEWPATQPIFEVVLSTLHFTQEAVIRPTDSSPPPTPTASPTPRIYIVQPGDTLGGIALEFGVTIEALVTRNSLEDARLIRTGQKLIIPNKRK
ncbi:MAG TPA: LysM peptidoglycan-binding domain-containing protein [Anaerolineae bacterium]|nr:LysM peptidoglycan-binding domain-containing protein [Anaerolineae bacterium]